LFLSKICRCSPWLEEEGAAKLVEGNFQTNDYGAWMKGVTSSVSENQMYCPMPLRLVVSRLFSFLVALVVCNELNGRNDHNLGACSKAVALPLAESTEFLPLHRKTQVCFVPPRNSHFSVYALVNSSCSADRARVTPGSSTARPDGPMKMGPPTKVRLPRYAIQNSFDLVLVPAHSNAKRAFAMRAATSRAFVLPSWT
jgi:hypothetical protein